MGKHNHNNSNNSYETSPMKPTRSIIINESKSKNKKSTESKSASPKPKSNSKSNSDNDAVTKEIEDKYDDGTGILRRTTTIRTRKPDGTIATRKHKERITPDSPKYTPRGSSKPKVLRKGTRPGSIAAPSSPPLKSPKPTTTTTRTKKRIPSSPGRIPSMVALQ